MVEGVQQGPVLLGTFFRTTNSDCTICTCTISYL